MSRELLKVQGSISTMRGVKRPLVTVTLAWEAMASWPLRTDISHLSSSWKRPWVSKRIFLAVVFRMTVYLRCSRSAGVCAARGGWRPSRRCLRRGAWSRTRPRAGWLAAQGQGRGRRSGSPSRASRVSVGQRSARSARSCPVQDTYGYRRGLPAGVDLAG